MSLSERQISQGYRDLALTTIKGIEAGIQRERGGRRRIPGKDLLKEVEEFNNRALSELTEDDQLRFDSAYRGVLDIVRAPFSLRAKQIGAVIGSFGLECVTMVAPVAGERIAAEVLKLGLDDSVAKWVAMGLGGLLALGEAFAFIKPIDNIDSIFYEALKAGMLQNPELYKDFPLSTRA